jgi:hypothetical protein
MIEKYKMYIQEHLKHCVLCNQHTSKYRRPFRDELVSDVLCKLDKSDSL